MLAMAKAEKMKQEIVQCEENFIQALRASNVEALSNMMHDNLIYNNASGDVLTKEMDIAGFKSVNPKIEKVECLERQIEEFGDIAVVSTVIYLKGIFGGHQVEGKSRFLRTWKKSENGWKVIAAASINL